MPDTLLTEPVVESIGWALVHFLWQGTLIALAAAAGLAALPRARPTTRYAVACTALALMMAAPVVTTLRDGTATAGVGPADAGRHDPADAEAARRSASNDLTPAVASGFSRTSISDSSRVYIERALPVAVLLWLCGVLVLSLRLATGWYGVERLRRRTRGSLSESVQARVLRLSARLDITRRVRVMESAMVAVPALVGWIRPVILLPASVVAGMPPNHLDAVLAHELAHVRRHDYLVNALQAVVETLLFYHPAVWWCSHQVRVEREHCCDDLAVIACGDRVGYATALANLEELRPASGLGAKRREGRLALAATDGPLLSRVRRVLGVRPAHDGRGHIWVAAVGVAIVLTLAAGSTFAGAARQQAPVEGDGSGEWRPGPPRAFLIDLTARIAGWRGLVFSPVFLQAPRPPAAPVAPDAPAAPSAPAAPTPPVAPSWEPWFLAVLPAVPAPPEPPATPEPSAAPEAPEPPQPSEPPAAPSAPEPPAAPEPPQASAPPQPPAPPAGFAFDAQARSRSSWIDDGIQTTLDIRGRVTLSDDDMDIVGVESGGYFIVEERSSLTPRLLRPFIGERRSIEVRGRANGAVERRYFVGGNERAFEPDGRRWLGEMLPHLVRRSGFAAEARVTRILKRDGAAGVVREIGRLESDFVRSLYTRLLTQHATLSAAELTQLLQSLRIGSDFEMAQALIAIAKTQTIGEPADAAYVRAARTIDSDFELRRTLSSLLGRPRDAAFARAMFTAAESIDSDFELAEFLRAAATNGFVEQVRDAFFGAAATIASDFERRRALTAVIARSDVPVETLEAVLRSASGIGSDFEQAELLLAMARRHRIEGQLRDRFLDVVDSTIGSEHERGRVLSAVVRSERATR